MPLERVRLVQLSHASNGRRVGMVEESRLRLLRDTASVYELALKAIQAGDCLQHYRMRETLKFGLMKGAGVVWDNCVLCHITRTYQALRDGSISCNE